MRLQEIFAGLETAHGEYTPGTANGSGKVGGVCRVVKEPLTKDLWEKHIRGEAPGLGVIPINARNKCVWGCIDIDEYPLDHKELIKKIKKNKLPLIVFRSKSGGAHIFLFVKEEIPALEMREYLSNVASILGQAGKEIFPKQSEILVERGDVGNFLNMPYFGGDNTTSRYAFTETGEKATLEQFYQMYDEKVQSLPLEEIKQVEKASSPIKDGPPCLQTLCTQGFPEGTRNNGLFNIALYLKKANPSDWQDKVMEYNQKFLKPPLGVKELQQIITTHEKKDYFYKCKDAPIKSFCNSNLCRTRKFGVGTDGPDTPQMPCIVKYNSEPPLWFLDVDGKRLELDTDQLHNQNLFQKACMEKINRLPPTVKKSDWEDHVNGLLIDMVETGSIQEATEDVSTTGRFMDLLEDFTTHLQQALDKEEILMGKPWHDDEGNVWFRLKDLTEHLKRNNFTELSRPKIIQRIRQRNGKDKPVNIKGRSQRVWIMPRFQAQEEPFKLPDSLEDSGAPF